METSVVIGFMDLGLKIINTLSTIDQSNKEYQTLIEGSKIKIRSAIIKLKSCGFNPPNQNANMDKTGYWNYDARRLNEELPKIAEILDEVSIILKSAKPQLYTDIQVLIDRLLEIKAEIVIYADKTTTGIPAIPLKDVKEFNELLDILCKIDENFKV